MSGLTRRSLLGGLGTLLAAPAIVRAASLMPVKAISEEGFRFTGFYSLIPIGQFDSLAMDAAGNIWVAHSDGVLKFAGENLPVRDALLSRRAEDAFNITAEFLYSA